MTHTLLECDCEQCRRATFEHRAIAVGLVVLGVGCAIAWLVLL